jgi:hypothetical protein
MTFKLLNYMKDGFGVSRQSLPFLFDISVMKKDCIFTSIPLEWNRFQWNPDSAGTLAILTGHLQTRRTEEDG